MAVHWLSYQTYRPAFRPGPYPYRLKGRSGTHQGPEYNHRSQELSVHRKLRLHRYLRAMGLFPYRFPRCRFHCYLPRCWTHRHRQYHHQLNHRWCHRQDHLACRKNWENRSNTHLQANQNSRHHRHLNLQSILRVSHTQQVGCPAENHCRNLREHAALWWRCHWTNWSSNTLCNSWVPLLHSEHPKLSHSSPQSKVPLAVQDESHTLNHWWMKAARLHQSLNCSGCWKRLEQSRKQGLQLWCWPLRSSNRHRSHPWPSREFDEQSRQAYRKYGL